ncbi:MAG: helix-turn-helix transcriptional regulator [Microbacterium ginsengisoli]|jgi:DNA-binding HxlR family transcriptional regulator|uniref:winged helix-turn-helix transcriptional regulator n=1 Tax=Microbacterium TaxID=33882 RepID=UPI0006FE1567|nr:MULTISPECIES: helix-turn-helix domain-containing protein [Microbacterium]MBN9197219.1 helix-turn-helix transcriptional regulator [Microbacterium ginsengisoli]ODU52139.1 MAG: hypothetical protein ABT07_01470 [Microbacterium sp. SCN 70-10]KQR92941.1 hypothetical protein ASG00_01435 [Microbacterium sp. Leaf351]KQS05689.1 hypothetical protein ASF93_01795 [Microbacterium sp. Leaf347]KXC07218.1 hypothetical protein MhomT_01350 [Microbacterium hominis]
MSITTTRPLDTAPLAAALETVGDRWSLAILHAIAAGATRFTELQITTAAPRASLTSHLRHLEHRGLIRRAPYQLAPSRWEYRLTDCGAAIIPHATALADWAAEHLCRPAQGMDGRRGAELL